MAINYFKNFPVVNYSDKLARNLTLRTKILDKIKARGAAFFFFTLREGDRPDTVANDFYSDSKLAWLVLLSNDIIDPYFDWFMSTVQFEKFLQKKFGSVAAAIANIVHYKKTPDVLFHNIQDPTLFIDQIEFDLLPSNKSAWTKTTTTTDVIVTKDAFDNLMSPSERTGFIPVNSFTIEDELNESKRDIRLIKREFVSLILSDLRDLLNDD